MPAKKKAKLILGQTKLSFPVNARSSHDISGSEARDTEQVIRDSEGSSLVEPADTESVPATAVSDKTNVSNTNSNQVCAEPENECTTTTCDDTNTNKPITKAKLRKFSPSWLRLYSWLKYNEKEGFMYCQICTEQKKCNGLSNDAKCRNFQKSTLTRHVSHRDHQAAVSAPKLRKDFEKVQKKCSSKQDQAATILLKCVHWLVSENIPLLKFKSLVDLLHELEVPNIDILKQTNINYDSSVTATDILASLAQVLEEDLMETLKKSPVVTALADESTDVSNHKRLVIYAQTVSEDMQPSTHYVTNVECKDATGVGIASAILHEFDQRGVKPEKILSLGSDGASVMTGKRAGAAAIIKQQSPHCVNVHCIAHRLALCTSQSAQNIPALKEHQQILTDLFYYFKSSSKRAARIKLIQELLEDPILSYKEIHSVRWLSYFIALSTIHRTLDSLLTYLAEAGTNDPKALGLKKKIASDKFVSITGMMMDAMAPVTILSQFFQTENVDVALVKVKIDLCISDLRKVQNLDTPYLHQLKEDMKISGIYKGHHITKSNFNLKKLTDEFISTVVENIESRFPSNDLVTAFGVLAMRPITHMSPEQLEEFGQEEISRLCDHFGVSKSISWTEDGVMKQNTSGPLINTEETEQEWHLLKKIVLAEQFPRDCMWKLWSLIAKFHKDFPNMIRLAQLALTSAVHTAGCERGFSVQNQVLTRQRNRLNVDTQNKLMRIKLGPKQNAFDFMRALKIWKSQKDRRLYELKQII